MKNNCIVVDDEPMAVKKLEGFINKYNSLQLLATFNDSIKALHYIKENPVDIIFLDIEMPDLDGFSLLATLQIKPKIIIVSAFQDYALRGYEYEISDYLLKPFSFERFVRAVEKVDAEIQASLPQHNYDSIFIRNEDVIEKINFDDILYVKSEENYVRIIANNKTIVAHKKLKSIEMALPPDKFIRTHKSYIVSIKKIESINNTTLKIGENIIPISSVCKDDLYNVLNIVSIA